MNQQECDTQARSVQINGNNGEGHRLYDTHQNGATPNGNGTGVQIEDDTQSLDDARPAPKTRKREQLWQAYLWWHTVMETRKASNLRISSIDRGKSSMDKIFEQEMKQAFGLSYLYEYVEAGILPVKKLEKAKQDGMAIDYLLKELAKVMTGIAKSDERLAPTWDWLLSIKGIGESLAAQLVAQIDDIDNSPTVSALWRFAGFSVVGGKAEKNQKGVKSPFNRKLKGICYNIADQFIRQQTPYYVDIYYAEKARLREKFPKAVCRECGDTCISKQKKVKGEAVDVWRCENNGKHTLNYTDAHLHNMAWRKMIKVFLKDLWNEWKRSEGQIARDTPPPCA